MIIVGCFNISACLYYGAVIGNPQNFSCSANGRSSGVGRRVREGGGGTAGDSGAGGGGRGLENVVMGLGMVVIGLESGVMGLVVWVLGW